MLATHLTDSLDKADEDAADIAHTKVVDHMAEAITLTPVVIRAEATVAEAEVPVAEVEDTESLAR